MIPLFKPHVSEDSINLVNTTLRSGYIAQGKQVDQLEEVLRDKLLNNYVVAVNSCTSALHLSYVLIKEQLRQEQVTDVQVIATPITCAASNIPIIQEGFHIKWCDIDRSTMNMNLHKLKNILSEKTRVVSLTAWGGYPPDMDILDVIINEYQREFGRRLFVVLDLAHAYGSTFERIPTCSAIRDIFSCYSLQAIKSLTAGDGGILVTPQWAYSKARMKRWFGLDRDSCPGGFRHCQDITTIGYKYNMNDINASIALGNLKGTDTVIRIQRENSDRLRSEVKSDKITHCLGPSQENGSSCWLHTVIINHPSNAKEFIEYLAKNNIEANPVHTNNANFTVFKNYRSNDIPIVNELELRRCCIPCGYHVSEDDLKHIIKVCNAY